jgi:hypothetical protein
VVDLDFFEDRPFLVMEYVAGCHLEQHAGQHRLPPRRAAALVAELARVVALLHRRGIIHQDIKPRNILVDELGRPRLIDFGLARLHHAWSDTPDGPSGGTLTYMAPEQARGESERIGQAADIFALGGVLHFLLTGRAPFTGRTTAEVWARAERCDLDAEELRRAKVPRRLERICLKAMAAEPDDRHPTADALARELEQFARGPRRLAPVGVGLAVILAGLAAWTWWPSQPGPSGDTVPPRAGRLGSLPGVPALPDVARLRILVERRGMVLDLENAVPLGTGDKLQITCDVPQGARPSVYWFDSEGSLTELAPVDVTAGERADVLSYPRPGDVIELAGVPGTEFIMVSAGSIDRTDLETLLNVGHPWPSLPERTVIRLNRDRVEPEGRAKAMAGGMTGDRGPGAVGPGALAGVHAPLERFRLGLRDRVAFLAGVAFPHGTGDLGVGSIEGTAQDRRGPAPSPR